MRVRSFSHAGITVSDFDAAVQFYWEVFHCPLVGVADQPPERVRSFFGVGLDDAEPSCKVGWIRAPGGAVIEIFEFRPRQPPIDVPWNRVGLTHIAFNVRGTRRWHAYLKGKGVECVTEPERSPRGHTFFFAKDIDGNLIELMDLGYMHHVLTWLGPLAGGCFVAGGIGSTTNDPRDPTTRCPRANRPHSHRPRSSMNDPSDPTRRCPVTGRLNPAVAGGLGRGRRLPRLPAAILAGSRRERCEQRTRP